ncbi:Protein of unknown function [Haloarcula vallismortis]|uniref:DUF3179 domain-containing protein n=2 Tax=Haloarcula vallismortis TaxID=28442 RepID=M0JPP7_HALVA|nr:DUF3179 domain-containing protein [Haloarcula vallismortis]EMA10353.1 hypothetical protein C437_03581 [Haloarcula vallismortis ATCC 29715]SDW90808.1 Protein of unknown function [Haloarcula vallismortis]
MGLSRRRFVATVGAGATLGSAGCVGNDGSTAGSSTASTVTDRNDGSKPPTADSRLHLDYEIETLEENIVSGGVRKDGIPAIDDPTFADTPPEGLAPDDPVFGVARDGEAKAYPQYILVHHEIVNDTIAGDAVAVTYCPLTGTAQGFERGPVEFGVSGRLVNSNLTMYDRGTDSWWPQMLATAITGPLTDESLREFRVTWTTWDRWSSAYPETTALTEDTGFQRRYGVDPYGQYNEKRGYYSSTRTLFEPLHGDSRAHPKAVVIGTRTETGALAFDKEALLRQRVLTGRIDDTPYVAVADTDLETGYAYANPESLSVTASDDGYTIGGTAYDADSLPMDRALSFDAMWFAWAGFYPESAYVS